MKPSYKKIINWSGSALAIISILFVVNRLNDYTAQIDLDLLTTKNWIEFVFYVFLYGLLNILLAIAWKKLLLFLGEDITITSAIRIYGISQLAKYIPSNIMHLASRQVMGISSGIGGLALAKSSIWELGLLSLTASCFTALVLPRMYSVNELYSLLLFFMTLMIVSIVLKRYISRHLVQVVILYSIFFIILGLIFVGVLEAVTASMSPLSFMILCGIFVTSWLIGFITPGAPAGIGVREIVLITLLEGVISESHILIAVIISRVITTGGDLIFFMGASVYSKQLKRYNNNNN